MLWPKPELSGLFPALSAYDLAQLWAVLFLGSAPGLRGPDGFLELVLFPDLFLNLIWTPSLIVLFIWKQFWRVAGRESHFPGTSGTSLDFRNFSTANFPELLQLWILKVIQRFPGGSTDFPRSSPTSPEVSPLFGET